MSENDFPMLPIANHVILSRPTFSDNEQTGGIFLSQRVEPKVQTCEVISVGEMTDKKESPYELKIGEKVMIDVDCVDSVNLLLKGSWYYIVPIKKVLAKIEEGEENEG